MEKGCPFLRIAYLIAKGIEAKGRVEVSVKDARCMGTYCALYPWCSSLGKNNPPVDREN